MPTEASSLHTWVGSWSGRESINARWKSSLTLILLGRKHPAVMKAGKTINMSDLEADSMLMFQHRNYMFCFLTAGFILPTLIPNLLWGESLANAYFMAVIRWNSPCSCWPDHLLYLQSSYVRTYKVWPVERKCNGKFSMFCRLRINSRYVAVLHFTWLVNSAAHLFGMKPYDENIGPSENRCDHLRIYRKLVKIKVISPNPLDALEFKLCTHQTCVCAGDGRGFPQLPPHLPLRLQHQRVGSQAERDDPFHQRDGQARIRLRSSNGLAIRRCCKSC